MPEAGKWNCIAPRLKATPSSATTPETKTRRVGLNDIIGYYTFRPSETKTKRHNEMRTQKPETEK